MSFKEDVIAYVKKIPRGKVASYGQVAAACGHPRAPRQVGGILKALNLPTLRVPWWRVVNSKGEISIRGNWTATKELQRDLLLKDGIKVRKNFTIDLKKYQWKQK